MIVAGSAVVSRAEPKSGCGAEDVTSPRRRFSLIERPEPAVFERDDAVEAAGEIEIVGSGQRRQSRTPIAKLKNRGTCELAHT
jgi:hypothetical protein